MLNSAPRGKQTKRYLSGLMRSWLPLFPRISRAILVLPSPELRIPYPGDPRPTPFATPPSHTRPRYVFLQMQNWFSFTEIHFKSLNFLLNKRLNKPTQNKIKTFLQILKRLKKPLGKGAVRRIDEESGLICYLHMRACLSGEQGPTV